MLYPIKKLSPTILNDFLDFFDHAAFSDNPKWDGCYCHFYNFTGTQAEWKATTKELNRESVSEQIRQDKKPGYLIFKDTHPIGWVNVGPKNLYPGLQWYEGISSPDDKVIISIVCFIIAPEYRKQGIATQLLKYVCDTYSKQILEAYPFINVVGDDVHYHGPLSMYKKFGFNIYRRFEKFVIVRKYPE